MFLLGLDLSELVPKFQSHDVTLDHLLNITDDELIKVGLRCVRGLSFITGCRFYCRVILHSVELYVALYYRVWSYM